MSKQLPSIFKNSSDKRINNNKRVFYSKYESIGNVVEKSDNRSNNNINNLDSPSSFTNSIDNLFKRKQFIFNVPVEIVTKENTFNTKIVSKVDDHILTSNGKIIQLEDILSIKINGE